jgi:hypothetical protein
MGSAMTRKTIDYVRLGAEACEAFTEGSAAFADFVRTILSIAAPLHVLRTATTGKRANDSTRSHLYPRRDIDRTQYSACVN